MEIKRITRFIRNTRNDKNQQDLIRTRWESEASQDSKGNAYILRIDKTQSEFVETNRITRFVRKLRHDENHQDLIRTRGEPLRITRCIRHRRNYKNQQDSIRTRGKSKESQDH